MTKSRFMRLAVSYCVRCIVICRMIGYMPVCNLLELTSAVLFGTAFWLGGKGEQTMKKSNIRKIVILGTLLAIEIVLSRFLSISTAIVKIGFAFVPVVTAAMLYGPVFAGCIAALGDFLGAILFPIGPYFPGFTLSAFIGGVIFGLILYNKEKTLLRIIAAAGLSLLVSSLILDTLWLYIITEDAALTALMPSRLIKFGIMLPIEVVVIKLLAMQKFVKFPLASEKKQNA